jgi:hypothetical protein
MGAVEVEERRAVAVDGSPRGGAPAGAAARRPHVHEEFGMKAARHIGASLGGSKDERDEAEADAARRMREAARPTDWQTRLEGMSVEQRVDATVECLGRRASFARVLRAVMEYCRQDRASEDVEAFIEEQSDFAANRQSARRYMVMLMRTGAVEETGADVDGNVVIVNEKPLAEAVDQRRGEAVPAAGEPAADAPSGDAAPGPSAAHGGTSSAGAPDAPAASTSGASAREAAADTDGVSGAHDGAEEPDPLDRVVAWRTCLTEAGELALARTDPLARLRELISGQPGDRRDAYLDVLAFCEEPRTLAEIADHLSGSPGLETDQWGVVHMEPNAYIGQLDRAGGLEWEDGWVTTEGGREVLDEMA